MLLKYQEMLRDKLSPVFKTLDGHTHEITCKIIVKYRDCFKVLRIVICKYKDLICEFYQKYIFRPKSHFESLFF